MLTGTVIVLALIVVLLAMPVTLTYRLSWTETLSADLRLNWAFGLVRADLTPERTTPGTGKPESARKKARKSRKSKGRKPDVLAAIRLPAFRERILRFVSDVWRAIHKQNVRLLVRIGLGDPADTGQLWAMLGPLSGMLARVRDVNVALEPDFLDATLDVDSSGTVRVIPLEFAMLALGLLFSPPIWRGLRLMRASG